MNAVLFILLLVTIVLGTLAFWLKFRLPATWSLVLVACASILAFLTLLLINSATQRLSLTLNAILFWSFTGFYLLGLILYRFFRDPNRNVPVSPNIMVSPADGTVRYIKEIENGEVPIVTKKGRRIKISEMTQTNLLEKGGILIGIEMNIINVHVNRSPISGRVIFRKHIAGDFLSLRDLDSIRENERVSTVIDHGSFKIGVVQIASRMVRRIVSYISDQEKIEIGQRIGMIKFGSQVDVIIPKIEGLEIRSQVGENVTAGQTIIALYKHQ